MKKFIEDLKKIEVKEIYESINNFKFDDIKNIKYRRLISDINRSKYTKPIFGIFSSGLLTIFIFIPTIKNLSFSFKKLSQYKYESKNLAAKMIELEKENNEFKEISLLMSKVNNSVINNEQMLFITKLLNEASKKSNVNLNSFNPILKADKTKLCKISKIQKFNKDLKSKRRVNKINKKGSLEDKFFEVSFSSNYLDIVTFLKEIQIYDITLIPYCLEVSSEQFTTKKIYKEPKNDSIIVPLDESGLPKISVDKFEKLTTDPNNGKVETRIVLRIPTFTR